MLILLPDFFNPLPDLAAEQREAPELQVASTALDIGAARIPPVRRCHRRDGSHGDRRPAPHRS